MRLLLGERATLPHMSHSANITVNIRNLAVGGDGVGEVVEQSDGGEDLLGITAFVPYCAVGEVVSARVIQKKDRYVKAELLTIEEESPARIEPPCPYYMQCGGCDLQHVSYSQQLDAKQRMIEGALKAAKLSSKELENLHTILPGEEYSFRRRVKLHVDASGRVGFYRGQSRSVVPISSCTVATPAIDESLTRLDELGKILQGQVSSVTIESDGGGVVAVLGAPYAMSESVARNIIEQVRVFFPNVTLHAAGKEIAGVGRTQLELPLNETGTLKFKVPAGSFSQVNWGINLRLIKEVVEQVNPTQGAPILDMYAGAGNFSLPLARAGAAVTAIECDPRLVRCGRQNAEHNGLQHSIEFIENSVEGFLRKNSPASATTIVADPPRNGLGSLISELGKASRLVFIACHLPSFVRDASQLNQRGWKIRCIQPFDMFAQTSYVEILGVFEREG